MANNVTVSNAPTSVNADIPVRSLDKGGEQAQVVVIDYGGAGAENLAVPDFATETTLDSVDTRLAGVLTVKFETYATATVTSVAATTSGVQLLASNANRRVAIFYNDSFRDSYIKFGNTISSSSFTYKLLGGSTLELPQPCYTGIVYAFWDAGFSGNMRITEVP
ncbi:MAG: hypothetical protein ACRC9R_08535 [Enterovibrio sp.]